MIEKLYTVEEVAELASVTGRTIRNYLKSGRLVGRKIGGQWRFPESEVQRLLTGGISEEEYGDDEVSMAPVSQPVSGPVQQAAQPLVQPPVQQPIQPTPQPPVQTAPPISGPPPASAQPNFFAAPSRPEQPKAPTMEEPVSPDLNPPLVFPDSTGEAKAPAAPGPVGYATPAPLPSPTMRPSQEQKGGYEAASSAFIPEPAAAQPVPRPTPAAPASPQAEAAQTAIISEYPPVAPPAGQANVATPSQGTAQAFQQNPFSAPIQAAPYTSMQPAPQQTAPAVSPQLPYYGHPQAYPPQPAPGPLAGELPQQPLSERLPYYPYPIYGMPPYPADPAAQAAFSQYYAGQVPPPGYPTYAIVPFQSLLSARTDEKPSEAPAPSPNALPSEPPAEEAKSVSPAPADRPAGREDVWDVPELSDVGKRVGRFISEVHDCSYGPVVCAVIDLYQSLPAAKATSERLSEIALQESDGGVLCQSFVEFDERYYVARYTLFGTSAFLFRCIKMIG